jgi:hypothetical protein
MDKDVFNTIADTVVRLNKPAVNWIESDGKRRWNIDGRMRSGITDAEALLYLQAPIKQKVRAQQH